MPVKTKPKLHEFTLILGNLEELTAEAADSLYQVFDDGTAGSCNGTVMIDFHREALTFADAVNSAISDVKCAGFTPARVETEESQLVEQINETLLGAS